MSVPEQSANRKPVPLSSKLPAMMLFLTVSVPE
jgi:hypothetical protein